LRLRAEGEFESLRGRGVFVALGEVRAFPPPRAGDEVVDAILVQIAEVRALTPELVVKLDALEGANLLGIRERGGGEQAGEEERAFGDGCQFHGDLWEIARMR